MNSSASFFRAEGSANSVDDDADGEVDEFCTCAPGDVQRDPVDDGALAVALDQARGTQFAHRGALSACCGWMVMRTRSPGLLPGFAWPPRTVSLATS